jgi:Transmembrane protein 231
MLMLLTLTLEHCRPAPLEMLKWGWVQFITTFLVVRWLLKRLERTIFGMRVLETRVVSDLAPGGHRF